MPTVLLFDIDGTLVSTGGAGRRAMERAFRELHGANPCAEMSFAGMTDRAIVRAGLGLLGARDEDADIARLLDAYLPILADEMRSAAARLHDGVLAALDEVVGRDGFAVGLGTGNVRAGARLKLEPLGVYDRFAFGGFGCDHEDRGELIRVGAERGAARLGASRAACRVVVIGDTPKDVDAARAIGAESLGVGTGSFTRAALLAHGATTAFDSLASDGAVAALLG
jgi:phosphoglycolate phosphatase-like HAD superfamily hydrolase